MNTLIALSLVLFFVGNEKLSRECVETLRSFVGIDAKVDVLNCLHIEMSLIDLMKY